jgi:transmembrane sensor
LESNKLISLFNQYLENKCAAEEVELLMLHFHTDNAALLGELVKEELGKNVMAALSDKEVRMQAAINRVHLKLRDAVLMEAELVKDKGVVMKKLWPRIAGIAAAVAAIVVGVYFFTGPKGDRHAEFISASQQDIAPGKNGATITLANGKVIQLSDAKLGVVVGLELKYNDGATVQGDESRLKSGEMMQMTASTAKGQTYQFTLPDGTKVWLNADSKLEFPSSFVDSKTRFVKLSGEGYFEVAKMVRSSPYGGGGAVGGGRDNKTLSPQKGDLSRGERIVNVPFIVQTDKQEVEALGTHFNINAYRDEVSVKTTLLEGSVRVSRFSSSGGTELASSTRRKDNKNSELNGRRPEGVDNENRVILKPNQQALLTTSNQLQIKDVDVTEAVAWKDGKIIFNDESLVSIMRRMARWYNVDVVYNGDVSDLRYGGAVSRTKKISSVLSFFDRTGNVKIELKGRTVIITKNNRAD